jgi:hypothetical protein
MTEKIPAIACSVLYEIGQVLINTGVAWTDMKFPPFRRRREAKRR